MSYLYRKDSKDKRGKWSDIFKSVCLLLLLYLTFRWILWEPFVIPSGSMKETLLIQDYVIVKKWAYGIRIPFTETWISGPKLPRRGDIVVFKAKDESGHFLVKRVVGLPGEKINMDENGSLSIDGKKFAYNLVPSSDKDYNVFTENNGIKSYRVQYFSEMSQEPYEYIVPAGEIFMMGDNRNQSADSRYWGSLPLNRIMGQLTMIWMSCEESDKYSSFLCSPEDFRLDRFFKKVD
jgi:signal peptidase I